MRIRASLAMASMASLSLAGCGGGGGGSTSGAVNPPVSPPAATTQYSVPAQESLSVADVQQVMAQAVAEAQARGLPSAIAVVDRVGNVLGVFVMNGANLALSIPNLATPVPGTLPGTSLPAPAGLAGAIAKAVTGAYLSSSGNAFSTRTASFIVQQHFPPQSNAANIPSGPLYGVQFSQLPCSDLSQRFGGGGGAALIGPKRSPLGLSADAGGFPLYKNGVVVGGIGVMGDGVYGFDPDSADVDSDNEEFIALAGTRGFDAPDDIKADRIQAVVQLRYSDATTAGLKAAGTAPAFSTINGTAGNVVAVPAYAAASIIAGSAYGAEGSGIRASTAAEFSNRDAFVLTNGSGSNRYPVRAGTDSGSLSQPLTQAEAQAILEEAFKIMTRTRAQIRRPLDSKAQVSISLVDTHGSVLGLVRSPDAPIFGVDVSLQKARTAAFFSNAKAAAELGSNPDAKVQNRLALAKSFLGDPAVFTGQTAWTNRAIGNIARPYFPDGEIGRGPGPFSPGIASFNPFHSGLQSELVFSNIVTHVGALLNGTPDTPARCTQMPDVVSGQNRLQNGIQIFPGSVPVYRGSVLVGALGVSGDGIDQDDMIAFLGTNNGGSRAGGLGNAPSASRSDQIVVSISGGGTARLRFVGCPFAPLLDTSEQNVCQGL